MQVDGEGSPGALKQLQPQDLVQDVMQRAVEQELIDPIRWKDVAGWKLQRPDGAFVKEDGRRSEPLLDLPPFPSKSLLVLTRRPIPPTTSSSSSSPPSASSTTHGQLMQLLSYTAATCLRATLPVRSVTGSV